VSIGLTEPKDFAIVTALSVPLVSSLFGTVVETAPTDAEPRPGPPTTAALPSIVAAHARAGGVARLLAAISAASITARNVDLMSGPPRPDSEAVPAVHEVWQGMCQRAMRLRRRGYVAVFIQAHRPDGRDPAAMAGRARTRARACKAQRPGAARENAAQRMKSPS